MLHERRATPYIPNAWPLDRLARLENIPAVRKCQPTQRPNKPGRWPLGL